LTIFLLLFASVYAGFCLILVWTWSRMPVFSKNDVSTTALTVIIPVRNEAANLPALLADLAAQTYRNFEVIVVDDSSTDGTAAWAEGFDAPFRLRVLRLHDEPTSSPKKRAIRQAMQLAEGPLIVTTDGDCRVGSDWLRSLALFYEHTGARLISGPVTLVPGSGGSIFTRLQVVEFASLIGSGAVTMALGRPSLCNGANLCYEKAAFEAVGGFSGNEHLASGDDEFLMHKIAARFPGDVHFLKDPRALVQTEAHSTLGAFYRQRRRWASKWRHYSDWRVSALAVAVFLANVAPVLGAVSWGMGWIPGGTFGLLLLLKFSVEAVFLALVLRFLGQSEAIPWIPLTQVIYPAYVTFFGLAAQGKGYRWKGRKLE